MHAPPMYSYLEVLAFIQNFSPKIDIQMSSAQRGLLGPFKMQLPAFLLPLPSSILLHYTYHHLTFYVMMMRMMMMIWLFPPASMSDQ